MPIATGIKEGEHGPKVTALADMLSKGHQTMNDVSISANGFVVDAALVGRAFRLAPETVKEDMRNGRITSRCDAGVDADEGRWRVTFYRDGRAFRLVVNAEGEVLSRSTFPVASNKAANPG